MNKEFLSILERSKEIHIKKNQDYTSGTNVDENFERVAEIVSWFNNPIDKSFASFIAVKLARLASLLNKSSFPNFESVDDTFVDFVTYGGLWGGSVVRRLSGPIDSHYGLERYNDLRGTPFENGHSIEKCEVLGCNEIIKPLNNIEKRQLELSTIAMTYNLNEEDLSKLISLARILKSKKKVI